MHRVEMPVDGFGIAVGAIRSEAKILVTQQAKTIPSDVIGLAQDCSRLARQMPLHQGGAG